MSLGGSDSYSYRVLVDGVPAFTSSPTTSGYYYAQVNVSGAGPHSLAAQFSDYRNGGSTSSGVWLDNISFDCMTPVGAENANDYQFLQGTSMAAPHVSGAALLLAAYEPQGSVSTMKQALLTSVDPIADLNPNTGTHPVSSGGRLDANAALAAIDSLVDPNTATTQSPAGTSGWQATFAFEATDTRAPATFECGLDGGAYIDCPSPVTLAAPNGAHTFAVRAKDSFGNVDASPATASWTVSQAPGKVTGVKVKRKARKATLRWKAAAGATSYKVRWTKGGKWVKVTKTKKVIKKLAPKKKYKVQIVAVNSAGKSRAVTVTVKKFRKKKDHDSIEG